MERIVGVAIIINGHLYEMEGPARHHNVIRMAAAAGERTPIYGEQGFITDSGRFIGRAEARKLAMINGQCPEPSRASELFSEDLW